MFIDWLMENHRALAEALDRAIKSEALYFDAHDGRFLKDKLHMHSIQRQFPNVFQREESSVVDLVFNPTGEGLSLKSQKIIFQRELLRPAGKLSKGNNIVLVNADSAYASPDLDEQFARLQKSKYLVLYQPGITIGVIEMHKVRPYLEVAGSQIRYRAPNAAYTFYAEYSFDSPAKDRIILDQIFWSGLNNTFDAMLSV